jgi:hypothetical protein
MRAAKDSVISYAQHVTVERNLNSAPTAGVLFPSPRGAALDTSEYQTMRIVTDLENPWNDNKDHYSIPLHRYGDLFFIREITEENSGTEFPQRLDGATFGEVHFLMKDKHAVEVLAERLAQISVSLFMTVSAMEEKERSSDGKQI